MHQKEFISVVAIIGVLALAGIAGYFIVISKEARCTDYSVAKINDDPSFIYTYNKDSGLQAIPEKKFEGILKEYDKLPPDVGTTVQRDLTYNLDGKAIYATKDDLSKYVGKRVILTGKNYKFELEGSQRDEIWPVSIVCTPSSAPAPSPSPKPNESEVFLREGQREGPFLLEKIYPDRITGLNFKEYPVPFFPGPVTLRIGEIVSNGCTITLTLTRIGGNTATFIKNTDLNRPCTKCLAEDTLIDTPSGLVPVKDIRAGSPVWTTDKAGRRVSGVVTKTSKVPVLLTHRMIHLALDDGRELVVSPGHPTADGRSVGDLMRGDLYDGASVASAERLPYGESATYDILPSGETGLYWANGILLDSTLH